MKRRSTGYGKLQQSWASGSECSVDSCLNISSWRVVAVSLKNHGVEEVDDMFDMGRQTLALPLEEKIKFEQGNEGFSFGSVMMNSLQPLFDD